MTSEVDPSRRVRVTGPRTGRSRRRSVAAEIDAQTELGEVYMRSLIRAQLRLALEVLGVLALTVGTWPLLFERVPWLRHTRLAGVPLPWLLLGLVVYPLLVLLAWTYTRRAERNEQSFDEMVRPR